MSQNVKIGFVGTGGIANHHLRSLEKVPGVQIVGLCDLVEERAAKAAAQYGGKVYTDYRRMIDELEMDGMYVCVPPFAHEDAEVLAARKGVHIFAEKPVAMHLEKGLEILEAIEKAGVLSSVGHSGRYSPTIQATRKFIEGRPVVMVNAVRWGNLPGDESHWWRDNTKSGGQLLEMAVHQIDTMRFLAGDIARVYARYARRATLDVPGASVPDAQVVALEFASGAVGYISTSCALNKGGYVMNVNVILKDVLLDVSPKEIKVTPEEAGPIVPAEGQRMGIDESFVKAIQTGDASYIKCDFREGLKSTAVCIAANQSAASGIPVDCWNGKAARSEPAIV